MMLVVMEKGITMIMILIYFPEGGGLNRLQWFSYSQSFAASNKVFRSIFHSSAVFNLRQFQFIFCISFHGGIEFVLTLTLRFEIPAVKASFQLTFASHLLFLNLHLLTFMFQLTFALNLLFAESTLSLNIERMPFFSSKVFKLQFSFSIFYHFCIIAILT